MYGVKFIHRAQFKCLQKRKGFVRDKHTEQEYEFRTTTLKTRRTKKAPNLL